ncbi:MAG: hypothetical protein HOY79_48085 [Streptomyces sp.]|nr:hypothetical protein [Streptomyces sp.]
MLVDAYQHALTPIFGYLVPLLAVVAVLAFLLPQRELSDAAASPSSVARQAPDDGMEAAGA